MMNRHLLFQALLAGTMLTAPASAADVTPDRLANAEKQN